MFNEGNQIHNFMSSSGSGSDFLTSYGSGSGSTSQKVTVPVPVPQHCKNLLFCDFIWTFLSFIFENVHTKSKKQKSFFEKSYLFVGVLKVNNGSGSTTKCPGSGTLVILMCPLISLMFQVRVRTFLYCTAALMDQITVGPWLRLIFRPLFGF